MTYFGHSGHRICERRHGYWVELLKMKITVILHWKPGISCKDILAQSIRNRKERSTLVPRCSLFGRWHLSLTNGLEHVWEVYRNAITTHRWSTKEILAVPKSPPIITLTRRLKDAKRPQDNFRRRKISTWKRWLMPESQYQEVEVWRLPWVLGQPELQNKILSQN